MEETYQVRLENVFEGPMDLLVYLIKKNEVNIYDIPIAFITDQFLEYLEWMKSLNIDFAGDFLLMASTLTQIKSKLLLPLHEVGDSEEDPRMEIARPLEEYIRMKSVAEHLAERDILGETIFARTPEKSDFKIIDEDEVIQVGLFELIDSFQKILKKLTPEFKIDLTAEKVSIREKISQIIEVLEEKGTVTFEELFEEKADKSDVIVTFLSILEMVRLNIIRIVQHIHSGIIRLFYI